jgi:hypothetical protein
MYFIDFDGKGVFVAKMAKSEDRITLDDGRVIMGKWGDPVFERLMSSCVHPDDNEYLKKDEEGVYHYRWFAEECDGTRKHLEADWEPSEVTSFKGKRDTTRYVYERKWSREE